MWDEKKISDFSVLVTKGTTPTSIGCGFEESGINYIKSESIGQGRRLDRSKYAFISDETHEKLKRSQIQEGDILFSMAGAYLGKTGIVTSEDVPANTNQAVAIIRLDSRKVNPEFVYYVLNQSSMIARVNSSSSQSAQPNINLKDIGNLSFLCPERMVQDKIVSLLSNIDSKIENNEKINRNLLNQGRALYEDLISSYEVNAKLSDLINSIETGSRPRGGAQENGVPSIGAEKIECFGVYDYSGEKYISEEFFEKLKRGRILSGDVLLYKDGAYTGKTSMALDDFPHAKCAINEHVYKLNSSDNLFQFFLYFTLDNKKNKDYIYTLASSKAAQPGLNQTELLSVEIVLPDKTNLMEFEKNISQMMHLIALNAKESRNLAILRDSILPRLMSGELDVSDLDI